MFYDISVARWRSLISLGRGGAPETGRDRISDAGFQWLATPRTARRAFSLMEIMVVLVLIGLLASLVTINVRGYLVRGRQSAARAEIAALRDAIESFQMIHSRYPTNEEGLEILLQSRDHQEPLLAGTKVPRDPWGNAYQYNQPGENAPYEVISFGADGRPGGDGVDEDIVSWNLSEKGE